MPRKLELGLLGLIVLVALVPRLLLQSHAPPFLVDDSNSYFEPAYDLASGEGLTTSIKRPAGYPFLIAAVFVVFGPSLVAVTATQHALGIVTVGLTYLLGRICFGRWVGCGAALLLAISSQQLRMEHVIAADWLFALLLTALALVPTQAMRAKGRGPAWPDPAL